MIFSGNSVSDLSINEAIKNGITKINPCDGLQWLKINNDRERFLSKEEIDLLFSHIEDEQIYLFTKLALITGARMQSILEIKKKEQERIFKGDKSRLVRITKSLVRVPCNLLQVA